MLFPLMEGSSRYPFWLFFFFNLAVLGLSHGVQNLHCHVQALSCVFGI